MEDINILKSTFVCPLDKKIEDCDDTCPHFDLCENWKEIMFQYMEDMYGALIRGLFTR